MIYSEYCNKIKLLLGGGRKVSMQQVIEAQIAENEARKSKQEMQRKLFNEAFVRYMRRKRSKESKELMEALDEQSDFDED